MVDLKLVLERLESVQNNALKNEIDKLNLSIASGKFSNAFACYGVTKYLCNEDIQGLKSNLKQITDSKMESIRWRSVFVFRAYTAFVYMRSDTLEKGLDNVDNSSSIKPFKDFFRSGSHKNNEDTIAQHIRNSLCHGSFEFKENVIIFSDRKWEAQISMNDFNSLCKQILRFYYRAYETHRRI